MHSLDIWSSICTKIPLEKIKTEKIDHIRMEEQFNNFQGFDAPDERRSNSSSSKKTSSSSNKKWLSDGLISNVQRLLVVVFLVIVLSHKDFFTAFGKGTGVSKAHISPLSITTRFLETTKLNKKNLQRGKHMTGPTTTSVSNMITIEFPCRFYPY